MRNWRRPGYPLAVVAGIRIRDHEQQSGLRIWLAPGTRKVWTKQFSIIHLTTPLLLLTSVPGCQFAFHFLIRDRVKPELIVAKLGQQQADQQTELVAQQIRFEVLKSYYGVLLAQSRVVVADEAIQIGTADLKRIKDKFETGFVVRSDLLAAEVQVSEFRQQKIQAIGELAIAQAALNTALGLPVNSPTRSLTN